MKFYSMNILCLVAIYYLRSVETVLMHIVLLIIIGFWHLKNRLCLHHADMEINKHLKSPLNYKLLFLFFRCLLWTASFLQMIRLGLKWHWITFAWVYRAIKIVDSFFFFPTKSTMTFKMTECIVLCYIHKFYWWLWMCKSKGSLKKVTLYSKLLHPNA